MFLAHDTCPPDHEQVLCVVQIRRQRTCVRGQRLLIHLSDHDRHNADGIVPTQLREQKFPLDSTRCQTYLGDVWKVHLNTVLILV
jgi:hypothetical protein